MAEQEKKEIDINTLTIDQIKSLILDQIDQQQQTNQNIQQLRAVVAKKIEGGETSSIQQTPNLDVAEEFKPVADGEGPVSKS